MKEIVCPQKVFRILLHIKSNNFVKQLIDQNSKKIVNFLLTKFLSSNCRIIPLILQNLGG